MSLDNLSFNTCGGGYPKCGGGYPKCGGGYPNCGGGYPSQSECSSSLTSAEIEILLRMGDQLRFVASGKMVLARLTENGN